MSVIGALLRKCSSLATVVTLCLQTFPMKHLGFFFFEDTGITNLRIVEKTSTRIRLEWDVLPSCYTQTGFSLIYRSSSGVTTTYAVPPNAKSFTLDGLDPNTNYTIEVFTEYGASSSELMSISTITDPKESIWTIPLIAGVSAGM